MKMGIKEFSRKFKTLKEMGFVPSKRRGPTGIGHTLENLLGLSENNVALPDLGKVELKAHRSKSTNKVGKRVSTMTSEYIVVCQKKI